jgi:prepilin-type N-terminal cleavage/methylation domain-containing protein
MKLNETFPVEKRNSLPCFKSTGNRAAFTLIEVMIAVAIFSMVIGVIYSTWTLILRARKVGLDAAANVQRQRIAMRTIEDALTCAQSFQASIGYYTFIIQNGDQPLLSFTARLPDNFLRNGKFVDLNTKLNFPVRRLTFSVEPGTDSQNNLVLRQNPIFMDLDADEQQNPLILARNVQTFAVECWDTNTMAWDDEWDNTNQIPPMVRVTLALGGNTTSSDKSPLRVVTRVIACPSETVPTAVQTPRANRGVNGNNGNKGRQNQNNNGPGGQNSNPNNNRTQPNPYNPHGPNSSPFNHQSSHGGQQ